MNSQAMMSDLDKSSLMRHYDDAALINSPAEGVFAFVDDHGRFSSHMSQSSWMMGGGHMDVTIDEKRGQQVGSHIRLQGKIFWIPLLLDEVVTRYEPPTAKTWETVGDLRLLVIGHYRMKIEVELRDDRSLLRVSIDYDLPSRNSWLGQLFGGIYAKWCVRQMTRGARDYFATRAATEEAERHAAPS